MATRTFALVGTLFVAVFAAVTASERVIGTQDPTPAARGAGYAWAAACRDCHKEIYASWEGTKHARAVGRLSGAEQEKECLNCHVTAGPGKIEQNGAFVNAGVQCEGCHGPAAAHVADPTAKTAMSRKPPAAACLACHNEKSPHYRGFHYQGMLSFSHPVKK